MNKLIKKKLNKKGFTLIELITVIAIVAILAVIGIPEIAGQVGKAQQAAANNNLALIVRQTEKMIIEDEIYGTKVIDVNDGDMPIPDAVLKACGLSGKLDKSAMSIGKTSDGAYTVEKAILEMHGKTATWYRRRDK